jgi:hypothetical protein
MKPGRTVEMPGVWKTRKTKPRFPSVSHSPWKSLCDSHIPTAQSAFVSQNSKNKLKKGDPASGFLRSRLQAHSSMRKCLGNQREQTGESIGPESGRKAVRSACAAQA